jgi:hypothetical protein
MRFERFYGKCFEIKTKRGYEHFMWKGNCGKISIHVIKKSTNLLWNVVDSIKLATVFSYM